MPQIFDLAYYSYSCSAWPPVIVGAVIAILGFSVLIREKISEVSLSFACLTFSMALWLVSSGGIYSARLPEVAFWWARVAHVGLVFVPSALLYFTVDVLRGSNRLRFLARVSLVSSTFFALMLYSNRFMAGMIQYPWGLYPQYRPIGSLFVGYFFTIYAISLVLYAQALRRLFLGDPQNRLKSLRAASAIGLLGAIDFLGSYHYPVYPAGYLAAFAAILMLAQVIWLYGFPDITLAFAAHQVLATMPSALLVLNYDGAVRLVNQQTCDLFGKSEHDLLGHPVQNLLKGFLVSEYLEGLRNDGAVTDVEWTVTDGLGRSRVLDMAVSVIWDKERRPGAFVCILKDISERRAAQEALRKSHDELEIRVSERTIELQREIGRREVAEELLRAQAITDSLTGLFNRRGFMTLSKQQLAQAQRNRCGFLIFMADIDDLKPINDTFGHPEGDHVLIQTAALLKATFRDSDIVARIGGDEFAVVALEAPENTIESFTARLQVKIDDHNQDSSRQYRLGLSMGSIRIDPEKNMTLEEMMLLADNALYEEKKNKAPSPLKASPA
jgi:diguanylate cyclase (GGDEF)-like protein/PAS domain S-box-containing protein